MNEQITETTMPMPPTSTAIRPRKPFLVLTFYNDGGYEWKVDQEQRPMDIPSLSRIVGAATIALQALTQWAIGLGVAAVDDWRNMVRAIMDSEPGDVVH